MSGNFDGFSCYHCRHLLCLAEEVNNNDRRWSPQWRCSEGVTSSKVLHHNTLGQMWCHQDGAWDVVRLFTGLQKELSCSNWEKWVVLFMNKIKVHTIVKTFDKTSRKSRSWRQDLFTNELLYDESTSRSTCLTKSRRWMLLVCQLEI